MATASSTPPRKATRRTTSKATPAKAAQAPVEATEEAEPSKGERYSFELEYVPADTRVGATTRQGHKVKEVRSEKFVPPTDSGVKGQLYFPIGTRRVKITFLSE